MSVPLDRISLEEVVKVMTSDPLSNALWLNAQLQVMVRQQAQEIAELQAQLAAGGP